MRQLARRIQRLDSTGTFVDVHRSFQRLVHEAALEVDLPLACHRQLATAIDARLHARVEAIRIAAGPLFSNYQAQIVELVAQSQLPAVYPFRSYVAAGGLMSYEADCPALAQRAGHFVGKILQGAKPAELPVEQPTKYHLALNLKTAKALGITIPPSLLVWADEVIQ